MMHCIILAINHLREKFGGASAKQVSIINSFNPFSTINDIEYSGGVPLKIIFNCIRDPVAVRTKGEITSGQTHGLLHLRNRI
jgi:hypothetical protein